MKHWLLSLLLLVSGSISATQVPERMELAGLQLYLTDGMRQKVQKKLSSLMASERHYKEWQRRCAFYFPVVEKVMLEENLPDDFKYLALQESALVADAVSRSDAVGFWQFKDFTALEYGLRVDATIDQRKDIVAATRGAAKYLKKSHYYLHNWVYALLSYNLGLTGARNLTEQHYIGAAKMTLDHTTHQYIVHFLAHKLAFSPEYRAQPVSTTELLLTYNQASGKTLGQVAAVAGVPLPQLLKHNRWLQTDTIPTDRAYSCIIPVAATDAQMVAARLGENSQTLAYQRQNGKPSILAAVNKRASGPQAGISMQNGNSSNRGNSTVVASLVNKSYDNSPVVIGANRATENVQNGPIYPLITTDETREVNGMMIRMVTANGLPAFVATANQDLLATTKALDVKNSDFLKDNDMQIYDELQPGQVYYLKKKNKRGPEEYFTVTEDKTMWEVSQRLGIRLSSLRRLNRMEPSEVLEPGRVLWLKKRRPKKAEVQYETIHLPEPDTQNAPKEDDTILPAAGDSETLNIGNTTAEPAETFDPTARFHQVRDGESLYAISRFYNVTILELQEWNDLDPLVDVKKGQILQVKPPIKDEDRKNPVILPEEAEALEKPVLIDEQGRLTDTPQDILNNKPTEPENTQAVGVPSADPLDKTPALKAGDVLPNGRRLISHIVTPGENLWTIAERYKVAAEEITQVNKLSSTELEPSQKLLIPVVSASAGVTPTQPVNQGLPASTQPAAGVRRHTLQKGETLYGLQRKYGVTVGQIMRYNNISNPTSLKPGDVLYLDDPAGVATTTTEIKPDVYTAQPGDNLYGIAYKYNIKVNDLVRWNQLDPTVPLQVGQQLVLKSPAVTPTPNYRPATTPVGNQQASAKYHTVQKGETLYRISKNYGVTLAQLQAWNDLSGGQINAGQQLVVSQPPVAEPVIVQPQQQASQQAPAQTQQPAGVQYHTVQPGDTLYRIGRKYGVKVTAIMQLNNMKDTAIKIGQNLRVK